MSWPLKAFKFQPLSGSVKPVGVGDLLCAIAGVGASRGAAGVSGSSGSGGGRGNGSGSEAAHDLFGTCQPLLEAAFALQVFIALLPRFIAFSTESGS